MSSIWRRIENCLSWHQGMRHNSLLFHPSRLRWQKELIVGVECEGEPVLIESHKS